jgi:uncharacterized membrane protein
MRRASSSVFAVPNTSCPKIRVIPPEATTLWLGRGFADFIAHPGIGLTYGAAFAAFGWLLTIGLERVGMGSLILPLAAGFMLVAPLAAVGLYEVSRCREQGLPVSLASSVAAIGRNSNVADMGLVLLLLFFTWFQVAIALFALFYGTHPPSLADFLPQVLLAPQGVTFLVAGTAVGAGLAAVTFGVSVVSLPLLMDRDVSAVTAMVASWSAVRANWLAMIGWAATLAVLGFAGLSLLFVGLALTLPIAAHASWHAYRDLIIKD